MIFKPVHVMPNPDDLHLGEELAAGKKINRQDLLRELNRFYLNPEIKKLCKDHGLDDYLYHQAYVSFRKYCMNVSNLPTELYLLFSDLLQGALVVQDIFPYFLRHARKVFPHLECLVDLKAIGDLTDPPNWYPEARTIRRKIIFHSGPTNSGKTYHALERFLAAKSGVYCGPLKLLAVEICNKSNARGTPCDLVTGEERKFAREDGQPSNHVSCTVEMTNINQKYEVAVIDEIQVLKDPQRGWAWTRALLGVQAEEIHVCGEAAALDLVRELMISTGEEVEVKTYKRLTELVLQDRAVEDLSNVEPGDCIVCFNKQDIYTVSRGLERLGVDCAVIYGSLPPTTKLGMAAKFNDPQDPCNVMVATDAIGMGLNLNIKRIIFYSMSKLQMTETGEKEMCLISVSQGLQIAGRAGRFSTQWPTGYVTTFRQEEIPIMKNLLSQQPEEILKAGLHPTFDQIEMYAYHLPQASLSNLVDIFISLCQVDDSLYSLCNLDDFKFLADMIGHIKLPLKVMYTFCCAPINRRMPFVCTLFLKFARQFSNGEIITFDWVCYQVSWPLSTPNTIVELMHLEAVHDVFDTYLWLFYRFPDMFPDAELIRTIQTELDSVIEEGVSNIVQLLKNSESGGMVISSKLISEEDPPPKKQARKLHTMKVKSSSSSQEGDEHYKSKVKQKLTKELVDQGLLTTEMIEALKKEWRISSTEDETEK